MEDSIKAKAYKEAFVILSYVPREDLLKIPKVVLEKISNNMDKNYQYDLKLDREIEEEEMLPETKSLLALIFKNYWATEEQRKLIEQRRIVDNEILEQKKRNIYNPDNLFTKKTNSSNNLLNTNSIVVLDITKKTFLQKIFEKIRKLFTGRK